MVLTLPKDRCQRCDGPIFYHKTKQSPEQYERRCWNGHIVNNGNNPQMEPLPVKEPYRGGWQGISKYSREKF